ncbi:MAG TPA: ABC transporter ATP-binding protein [Thermoanaerobaculia bacterium]|nr:ABC transporter ATP-binding protein [Thermoanaerobaculia bacterium]
MSQPVPDPAAPRVELDALDVRYGRVRALNGVSLRVEPGSVYALLGRNGAGKSSLIRCLLGHRPPSAGSVRLLGRSPWRQRAALMEEVAVVPERPDLPLHSSPLAVARFVAGVRRRFDLAGFLARLERLGVPARRPFRTLSRGQQTTTALALALASEPALLVLDDPTLGLDTVARRALYAELIETLAGGETTLLVTTHDLAGIERIATHVGILRHGRLVVDETLESLLARHRRVDLPAAALPRAVASGSTPARRRSNVWGGEEWIVDRYPANGPLDAEIQDAGLNVETMRLEEIFEAIAADEPPSGPSTASERAPRALEEVRG